MTSAPPDLPCDLSFFSRSYTEARDKFRGACLERGLPVESYPHPGLGPEGQELATDTVWIGPLDAPRVLITQSATHGVEGYCGSGVQVGSLLSEHHRELPPGVALLMIHAINPHGFAWTRRVNEDNIDLNRNFLDFDQALPESPTYDSVHDVACPERWDARSRREWERFRDAYIAQHGPMALQAAVSSGQWHRPDGLFYGGRSATWSNRTLHAIAERHLSAARQVAMIDYHTGLGPHGHGERICKHPPGGEDEARLSRWYGGDFTNPASGTSTSAELSGTNMEGLIAAHPDKQWTCCALEFGTQPVFEVLDALRADNWLHAHGQLESYQGRAIKAELRRCFYGETDDWKRSIWRRGLESQRLALAGLAESGS